MRKNAIIRGGQTALHEYRMSLQVAKTLGWIALGIALFFLIIRLALNLTAHEVYQWFVWYWAKFLYLASFKYEQEITIYDYEWNPYVTYTGIIIEHPGMTATKEMVSHMIFSGAGLGLSLGITISLIALVYFLRRGYRIQKSKHLRGSKILPLGELTQQIKTFNKKRKKKSLYYIAGVPFPAGSENTHCLISGTTAVGKTSLFCDLIEQIRKNGDRAIIYDKMGTFVGLFYASNTDVICNPFDVRSPNWSVFSEGRKASDFDMMAKALIPEQKGMADPFWVLAARILFSKVAEGLRMKGNPTNEQLVSKLLKIDLSEMAALLKHTVAQSIIDEQSPKTALSVRAVMTAYLSCLEHLPDNPKAAPFSIRNWIEDDNRDGFMFLTTRGDMHESIKGLTTCWLEIAVNTLLSLEQNRDRKIWFILDEVPSLFNIPSLQPGMAETRQFGGCFVLGLQVWSAMRDIYGANGAETLSGLARTRVVLSTPDKATADWCSQALGNAERTELQETLSYGAHDMRDGVSLAERNELRPIVLPTEIMSLPDLTGYLRLPQNFPITKFDVKPFSSQKIAKSFVEAPQKETRPINKPVTPIQPAQADKKPRKPRKKTEPATAKKKEQPPKKTPPTSPPASDLDEELIF